MVLTEGLQSFMTFCCILDSSEHIQSIVSHASLHQHSVVQLVRKASHCQPGSLLQVMRPPPRMLLLMPLLVLLRVFPQPVAAAPAAATPVASHLEVLALCKENFRTAKNQGERPAKTEISQ